MHDHDDAFQTIEVPVNLNGMMKVRVPRSCHPEDAEKLALEQFKTRLGKTIQFGESGYSSYTFSGEAWSTKGQARVGDLTFEVRHDIAEHVSGAMVAVAPAAGQFGADRLRARLTAYVSREGVFITGRKPGNDTEHVMVMVDIQEGEATVNVMSPTGDDQFEAAGQLPIVSVGFPNMCWSVN
ncbi:TPA: hypothetical protein ACP32N_003162 [Pseudomonas aeruginosa]